MPTELLAMERGFMAGRLGLVGIAWWQVRHEFWGNRTNVEDSELMSLGWVLVFGGQNVEDSELMSLSLVSVFWRVKRPRHRADAVGVGLDGHLIRLGSCTLLTMPLG